VDNVENQNKTLQRAINEYYQHTITHSRGRRGCDRIVVGFTCALSAYHDLSCVFEFR